MQLLMAGGGGGGGGGGTLQADYALGNTIALTAARPVALSNAVDAGDVLQITRTFVGAGDGLDVSMQAATTGHGVNVHMAATASGEAFRTDRGGGTNVSAISPGHGTFTNGDDAVDLLSLTRSFVGGGTGLDITMGAGTTGRAVSVHQNATATGEGFRTARGTSFAALDGYYIAATNADTVADLVQLARTFGGAGKGIALSMGATTTGDGVEVTMVAGATGKASLLTGTYSPSTAVNRVLSALTPTFSPSASSGSFAALQLNPTINGTSSGTAVGLAIASKTNTLTGGSVLLLDVGSTSTDYFTGYTSYFKIASTGAITAAPASGAAITMTTTAAALTLNGPSSSTFAIGSSGQITATVAASQAMTLTGAASASLVCSTVGLWTLTAAQGIEINFKDAAARATTSGNTNYFVATPRFTPGSGSASWVAFHLVPEISGTSSGTGVGMALAVKTGTLTGGTVTLQDIGTTSTDFYTGFTRFMAISAATLANDDTVMLLRYKPGAGAATVQRVTVGATDSGGTGFRALRVPN